VGGRVTRSLLGYGILAGPLYIVVALAQALTRDGFDLSRHPWSLLANGPHRSRLMISTVVLQTEPYDITQVDNL